MISVLLARACDDVSVIYESCFHQRAENQSVSQPVSEWVHGLLSGCAGNPAGARQ